MNAVRPRISRGVRCEAGSGAIPAGKAILRDNNDDDDDDDMVCPPYKVRPSRVKTLCDKRVTPSVSY
jgi:hypothetical protein